MIPSFAFRCRHEEHINIYFYGKRTYKFYMEETRKSLTLITNFPTCWCQSSCQKYTWKYLILTDNVLVIQLFHVNGYHHIRVSLITPQGFGGSKGFCQNENTHLNRNQGCINITHLVLLDEHCYTADGFIRYSADVSH